MTDDVERAVARWAAEFGDHGIFTTDGGLLITSWNRWLEKHSGFAVGDLLGQHLFSAFPQLVERALDQHYEQALQGKPYHLSHLLHGYLLPFTGDRNTTAPMRQTARIAPLVEERRVVGTITVIDDVRERVAVELELRQQQELLERRVEDRTRALAQKVEEGRAAERRIRNLMTRLMTVQEEERRRIARDLHDHLGQHLTALHLKLEMLGRTGPSGSSWQASFKELQAYLQKFDRELDAFTADLKLGGIYTLGIEPALLDQLNRWAATYGVTVEFEAIGLGDRRLPPEVETNLYRIVQEALTNIAKHARASRVSVVLQRLNNEVVLSIEDDGSGFEAAARDNQPGMGLQGMQERAVLLGGTANIESEPGAGTTIIIKVPAAS